MTPFFRHTYISLLALILAGVGGCSGSGSSQESGPVGESPNASWPDDPKWVQVWSDEFEHEGLPDSSKWRYETGGHGWGNDELQYYTKERKKNARVEEGHLIIEAHEETYEGSDYTSARLNSDTSWTYGRFEIRARVPSGRGTWPALWLLASQDTYGEQFWPDNGEIDIMEHVGHDPNVIHSTIHTAAYNHVEGTQRGSSLEVHDATSSFHTYVLEWTPHAIRSYVDGEHYFTFQNPGSSQYEQWPFNHDFHLILNIAVGGTWGGAEGVADDIWPAQMAIDYVRVFQPEQHIQ